MLPTFFSILENAVAFSSMNCWRPSVVVIERANEETDLQFVQIVAKLLKSFLESYEACRNFRSCSAPSLHHPFLVEKGLKTELELRVVQQLSRLAYCSEANLGLLLEVECIDFLKLSFLPVTISIQLVHTHYTRLSYQSKEECRFVRLQRRLRVKGIGGNVCSILGKEGWCSAQLLDEL